LVLVSGFAEAGTPALPTVATAAILVGT